MVKENMRFGKLITKYENGRTKNRNIIWHCICDCGNEVDIPSVSLSTGNTKSCGCLHAESMRKCGKEKRKLNRYDLSGDYGIGYTANNETFFFDKDDYNLIKSYTWRLSPDGYIITTANGNLIRMHILIMSPPKGKDVDHKNHIISDNRKFNLRICEHYQNIISSTTYTNNTSGRKGVSWDRSRNKWMASICIKQKTKYLGRFDNFEDAVKARELAEVKYHKEFAYS